jgi:hypothetical protein
MTLSAAAEQKRREITDIIGRAYEPEQMTPDQALEFLDQLRTDLCEMIYALQEEAGLR